MPLPRYALPVLALVALASTAGGDAYETFALPIRMNKAVVEGTLRLEAFRAAKSFQYA